MKILVSDLAKLYGISNQTLHYYEEKKILKPSRDMLNNYRYYEANDLRRLGAIKKYRNAGFSMKNALEMSNADNEQEVIQKLKKQRKLLKKSIERKQILINQIDENLTMYQRTFEQDSKYIVEELESFYMLASYGKEIIFQDAAFREEGIPWVENIFLTGASRMFRINQNTGKITHEAHGMLASSEIAKYLNLKITENVLIVESGSFVTSTFTVENDEMIEKKISDCLEYIVKEGFKLRGNPFVKTAFASKNKSGNYTLLMQLLVPIHK